MPKEPDNNPPRSTAPSVQRQGNGLLLALACLGSIAIAFALTMVFVNDRSQPPEALPKLAPALQVAVAPPTQTNQLNKIQALLEQQNQQMAQLLVLLENQQAQTPAPSPIDTSAASAALQETADQLKTLAEKNQMAAAPDAPAQTVAPETQRILQAIDELPFERYEQHLTQVLLTLKAQEKQLSPEQLSQLIAKAVIQAISEQTSPSKQADPFSNASLLSSEGNALTDLQQAFRDAFATGNPVTLPPRVDPLTGSALPGRTLDPQTAFRTGHRTWQAWYEADRAAEEKRLSQSARNEANPALTWE